MLQYRCENFGDNTRTDGRTPQITDPRAATFAAKNTWLFFLILIETRQSLSLLALVLPSQSSRQTDVGTQGGIHSLSSYYYGPVLYQ